MTSPSQSNQVSDKLWTPANVVTLIRICLVPVFVVALISPWPQWFGLPSVANDAKSLIAAGIFILISCTDWLDGYLARSRNEVTDFGKFMDPLADKILVVAALLVLIELGSLPSWVVLIIVAREFIVSGVRMVASSEGVVIAASWYGKFKTVFQMIAIVLFTVKDNHMIGSANAAFSDAMWLISWIVMGIALILTIASMLDYIAKARHLIGLAATPAHSAQKSEEDSRSAQSAHTERSALTTDEAASIEPHALASLAREVLDAAQAAGVTLGTAESLTGGLIAATLTEVPGSSESVRGGIVSYAADVKCELLGVDATTLATDGVVSEQTARAMAEGARRRLLCDVSVSVTGIAGPGGAEPGKPVGTVWMARSDSIGTVARCECFSGTRESVRLQTVRSALEYMLDALKASR